MGPEPTFSDALASEVKLQNQNKKQKILLYTIKQIQLNSKAAIDLRVEFFLNRIKQDQIGSANNIFRNLFQTFGTQRLKK